MRNKIRWYLIKLANWIGTKEHFDFGEPIVAVVPHLNSLIVGTSSGLFKYKEKTKTFKRISRKEAGKGKW